MVCVLKFEYKIAHVIQFLFDIIETTLTLSTQRFGSTLKNLEGVPDQFVWHQIPDLRWDSLVVLNDESNFRKSRFLCVQAILHSQSPKEQLEHLKIEFSNSFPHF